MSIKMIAAVSRNGVMGNSKLNSLPWQNKYPDDMKFFRKMTAGSTVIMGRKTFESIGKPLPKRRNIVVTSKPKQTEGIEYATSFKEAIEMACPPVPAVAVTDADGNTVNQDKSNVWLIGGSSIYREGLNVASEIYLTLIPEHIEGDNLVYFPWIYPREFKINGIFDIDKSSSELVVAHYIRI